MIFDDLRAIQSQYGYLPGDQLEALSKRIDVPLYRIHGVADFYPHFHLAPPPKVMLRVCSDMSCHLRGADPLRAGLKQRFQGMNESDLKIGDVSCLGQCDGAPAISINDHIFRAVTPAQAEALVLTALGGSGLPHMPAEDRVSGLASDPYGEAEHYGAVRSVAPDARLGRSDRAVEGQRAERARRRRIPHRHQVGSGAQGAGPGEIRRLQRR